MDKSSTVVLVRREVIFGQIHHDPLGRSGMCGIGCLCLLCRASPITVRPGTLVGPWIASILEGEARGPPLLNIMHNLSCVESEGWYCGIVKVTIVMALTSTCRIMI